MTDREKEQDLRRFGEPRLRPPLSAVRSLPEAYSAVIHLYYYEGYSIQEIARLLALPVPTGFVAAATAAALTIGVYAAVTLPLDPAKADPEKVRAIMDGLFDPQPVESVSPAA